MKTLLKKYGGLEEDEVNSKIQYWTFEIVYPDIEMTESQVGKFYNYVEPSGLSVQYYSKFISEIKDISGDDKKERIIKVIKKYASGSQQRKALYLAAGYKETTYDDVDW